MEQTGIIAFFIIIANLCATYLGLISPCFFDKYSFSVYGISQKKEYKRIITSGFLHVNLTHLLFNLVTLFWFSYALESALGMLAFFIIYFVSLTAGNLFALYVYRNHFDYQSASSTAAISGVVFSTLALFPGMKLSLYILPFYIPAWPVAIVYVLYSIYGIQSPKNNTNREAHLAGGIMGIVAATLMFPSKMAVNYFPVLLIIIPTCILLFLIITRPAFLHLERPFPLFQKSNTNHTPDEILYTHKNNKEIELDDILDQINEKGFDSLTKKEIEKLQELSKDS